MHFQICICVRLQQGQGVLILVRIGKEEDRLLRARVHLVVDYGQTSDRGVDSAALAFVLSVYLFQNQTFGPKN